MSGRGAAVVQATGALLNRVFSSAVAGVLVPLLSLLVGFTLTSWKDEILGTLFTFAWQDKTSFNEHATVFWVLIFVLAAVVWGGNWAKNRDTARNTAEVKGILSGMHAQSNKLTDAVTQLHSLPPRGVLEVCKEAYDLCEGYFVLAASLDSQALNARADLESMVRKILSVMERFVRTFDGEHLDGSHIRYGLNVMLFVQRAEYENTLLQAQLATRLHFASPAVPLDTAAGVLDLVLAMSVATNAMDGDIQLHLFALQIDHAPVLAKAAQASRKALPGATDACLNMIHTAVPSIEFLIETMRGRETDPRATQAVVDYFGQEKIRQAVQSFVCVPLIAKDTGMVGVLNIHRNATNPTIEDKLALLVPLMTPFRHQLARLMSIYKPLYLASTQTALPTRGQP